MTAAEVEMVVDEELGRTSKELFVAWSTHRREWGNSMSWPRSEPRTSRWRSTLLPTACRFDRHSRCLSSGLFQMARRLEERKLSCLCRHSNLGSSIQYMGVFFPETKLPVHEAKHWSAPNFEVKNEHSSASSLPCSILSCTATTLPSHFTWPWKICLRRMPCVTFHRPPVFLSAFCCGRCALKVRNHFYSLTGSISVLCDSLTGWTNWATNWSQGISPRLIVTSHRCSILAVCGNFTVVYATIKCVSRYGHTFRHYRPPSGQMVYLYGMQANVCVACRCRCIRRECRNMLPYWLTPVDYWGKFKIDGRNKTLRLADACTAVRLLIPRTACTILCPVVLTVVLFIPLLWT